MTQPMENLHRSAGRPVSGHATDRILLAGAAIQVALVPPTVVALFIDDRTLNGIGIWVKPLKFELSLTLNMLTILLLLVAAAPNMRATDLVRRCALVIAAASTFEIAYIAMQAARGVGSHFNVATPLARIGYGLMGVGAVAMVVAGFVIGWAMLRSGRSPDGKVSGWEPRQA